MQNECISYKKSGYFTKLITDYLDENSELKKLYNRFPKIENFKEQIIEKQENFPFENRQVLVSELEKQYTNFSVSDETIRNIERLNHTNTFTITTGHQLNLFTGPLYFLYKIVSTINLCKELKKKFHDNNFIPIYWMATEDHDFEEINYFIFKGKKFRWNSESSGPVGRLSTEGLAEVFDVFAKEIGSSTTANEIKSLFKTAYLHHKTLADATRFLANELFGKSGLVILDADSAELKREFIPFFKEELLHQSANKLVLETTEQLKEYAIQVNPRKINLFYIKDNLRERIVLENGIYKINNTKLQFSEAAILSELETYPENFSPNVILRPLYEEVILPNLCYIGGGGEIAYWLELKSVFDAAKITFPILLLRNSALLVTEKQAKKADKLNLTWKDLFLKQNDLLNDKTKQLSEFSIDLNLQKEHLQKQFEYLYSIVNKTDKSFAGAVKAQEAKQLKGLENLEKRLLKAQKRNYQNELERITDLQNELFPYTILQERQNNFSEFYIENGASLLQNLFSELKPLENKFNILVL